LREKYLDELEAQTQSNPHGTPVINTLLREADIVATKIGIQINVYNFELTRGRDSHVKVTNVRKKRVEW
jgi:hypothetical protein